MPVGVVVPLEEKNKAPGVEALVGLTAADMARVNETILARTGSDVTMIPEVANHLIDSGGKRHVALVEPALTNALVVYSFRSATLTEGGPEGATYEIQLRDLALAVCAVLAGKKPEDFGLRLIGGDCDDDRRIDGDHMGRPFSS